MHHSTGNPHRQSSAGSDPAVSHAVERILGETLPSRMLASERAIRGLSVGPEQAPIIVVANAPLYKPNKDGNGFELREGGLTSALVTALGDMPGSVVLSAAPKSPDGSLDFFDSSSLNTPVPNLPVPVPLDSYDSAYVTVANSYLWPLSHGFTEPQYYADLSAEDLSIAMNHYRNTNAAFAAKVFERMQSSPDAGVWVHDYQLAMVPGLLRASAPQAKIGYFHHIPVPEPRLFLEKLPLEHATRYLSGLLGSDLIGFHTRTYAENFLKTVHEAFPAKEVRVDSSNMTIAYRGRFVSVGWFPISVNVARIRSIAESEQVAKLRDSVRREHAGKRIFFGVERFDYTKGINERLLAFEKLLDSHPELVDKVVFIQHAAVSRGKVPAYAQYAAQVKAVVERIEYKYPGALKFSDKALTTVEMLGIGQAADIVVVTPIKDGMNLVIKEQIIGGNPDAAFILGVGAGAAEELTQCELVYGDKPASICKGYEAALEALANRPLELRSRVAALRSTIGAFPVSAWTRANIEAIHEAARGRDSANYPLQGVLSSQRRIAAALATPNAKVTKEYSDPIAIASHLAAQNRVVLVVPFDDGLARITNKPSDTSLDGDQLGRIVQLMRASRTSLVVTSGRSLIDLASKTQRFNNMPGVFLSALHGGVFTCGDRSVDTISLEIESYRDDIKKITEHLTDQLSPFISGGDVTVEDKGSCLTLHSRSNPRYTDEVQSVADAAIRDLDLGGRLKTVRGNFAVEIMPAMFSVDHVAQRLVTQLGREELASSGEQPLTGSTPASRMNESTIVFVLSRWGTEKEILESISELHALAAKQKNRVNIQIVALDHLPELPSGCSVVAGSGALYQLFEHYVALRTQ